MRILLTHYRVGETDGVSLEMDKWKWALEQQGHEVFYLAGSAGCSQADCVDALKYDDALNARITQDAFIKRTYFASERELLAAIEQQATEIAEQVTEVITRRCIDVVVPNNIFAVGHSLAAAIGLYRAVETTGVRCINHHHDFHWERDKFANPCYPGISQILEDYFPPKRPQDKHCVINQLAHRSLKNKTGYDSTVVPNVFDFDGCDWQLDDYNRDLRSEFGIRDHDVVFLQGTRIVARKGIELAIDLIAQLNQNKANLVGRTLYNGQVITEDSRLLLVFAGMCEEDEYLDKLISKAEQAGVELLFINQRIRHSRGEENGVKYYSLWDAYVHADIVTYPSLLEGWGNQFLEGLVANMPMVVFRYPVYATDIEPFGFNIIDLGDTYQLDSHGLATVSEQQMQQAVAETEHYLFDATSRQKAMAENYAIGQEHLSYRALGDILERVFS